MKYLKILSLIIPILISTTIEAKECKSNLIEWNNYDQTLASLKNEYYKNNFTLVESALDCLVSSNKTFISGKPGTVAAYWFFRKEMPAPGGDELDERRINDWKSSISSSPYAHFASLRLMYSKAWNARGTKYANETSEDQFNRFKTQLLLTESAILSDANKLKNSAISYNLLMAVALDTRGTKTSPIQTFETGVINWPNYYDFYEVFLTRLVPKWGGSWEKVDEFINYWDEKLAEAESKSLYARLYINVHKHNKINPHKTKADWKKLKPSLIALYTNYPAQQHLEVAASYACYYADHDFYKKLLKKHNIRDSKAWLRGSTIEQCNSYFAPQPNKSKQQDK